MNNEDKDIEATPEKSVFFPAWNTADPYYYLMLKEQRKEMRDNMTNA